MPSVLVIEDNPETLGEFSSILSDAGFEVSDASTGRQGITLSRQARYSAILADLCLGDTTALNVLKELRATGSPSAVIVVTAFGSIESAVEAMKLGAADYIEKPIPPEDVIRLVRQAIAATPLADGAQLLEKEIRTSSVADRRVRMSLRIIRDRFAEVRLSGRSVAAEIGISHSFLAHLLKRETGRRFLWHLHSARVRGAQKLLDETVLSVKEIASRVGYSETAKLDHNFRRICRMTPRMYRGIVSISTR